MNKKKLFIETYGCQMNFSDSEIVASIMKENAFDHTENYKEADIIFVNTCSIRDHAEQRVFNRLEEFKSLRKQKPDLKIGLLGCMAERLKEDLLEKGIDVVVGPDAYRDLPKLVDAAQQGESNNINVLLSEEETYADIQPVRYDSNGLSAFISIMRGCQNFCSYCVVPYTRGKERSRNPESIVSEARDLFAKGYREITLLGQNVNSYRWSSNGDQPMQFAQLLSQVAAVSPELRVRFATSHPKDISDELIETIANTSNICNSIHLPVQSGSSEMLKKMNRKYDREWYLERISKIKSLIPDCGLSTDIIAGFCGETEEDHKETLSIMQEVGYDFAFMFKYSNREGTYASKHMTDDVDEKVKGRRLQEIIQIQQELSHQSNKNDLGKTFEVLVEGTSKRRADQLMGRNSQNKVIVFPSNGAQKGDYVQVKVTECTAATLIGEAVNN